MVRRQEDGIYVDAGYVRRYDPGSGAYIDAESGKAQKEGAWEEVWPVRPKKMYLYNRGDECAEFTGGWTYTAIERGGRNHTGFKTAKQIPFSKYGQIGMVFTCQRNIADHVGIGGINCISGETIELFTGTSSGENCKKIFTCWVTDGEMQFYTTSNAYSTVLHSGNKEGECLYLTRSYYGVTLTARIYEIWLE